MLPDKQKGACDVTNVDRETHGRRQNGGTHCSTEVASMEQEALQIRQNRRFAEPRDLDQIMQN